ncbi:MAG: hypothetical protein GY803_15885 [Chloroflexi bacterium]|nr:hypothetical protein [Chloroflexota bacterium]
MSFSGPVLLIWGPLLAAATTLALGRWRRVAAIAGAALAGLLWLRLWFAPLDEQIGEMLWYGRSLTMTLGIRSLFLFLLAGAGTLFLLSLPLPQGRYFVSAGLAVLSPLAAMLMIRPSPFSALFWLLAAAFLVILLQSGRVGQAEAGFRYLTMIVIATPLLLTADWMLDIGQAGLQTAVAWLLAAAFIILLAGFPFHIWIQPLVAKAPSLAMGFLFGLAQLAVTLFAYDWLIAHPWLLEEPAFASLLRWSAGLAALTAGLLALTAADYDRLIGSLLLLDMSVALALLAVPVAAGLETAVMLPLARFVNMLAATVGLHWLSQARLGVEFAAYRGLGRQMPVKTAVFAFGLVSLLGLPLTIGFNGRWSALAAIAAQSPVAQSPVAWGMPAALLLAMGGGIYGTWRGLAPMLFTVADDSPPAKQRLSSSLALTLGLVGGILLIGWPRIALSYARHLADLWLLAG